MGLVLTAEQRALFLALTTGETSSGACGRGAVR